MLQRWQRRKKSRGGQVLERSALLGAIFFSAGDDAGEKGDELGDTLGGTPSANARAAAARGVAGGVKAPLRLPSPAAPGKPGMGTPTATAELRPPLSTSSPGGRVGDATFASVVRPSNLSASAAPTSTARQLRPASFTSSSLWTDGQLFADPGRGAPPSLIPPTLSQRMMGPQAGVQGFGLTREELDFQSEEISVADIQAMAAAAGARVGAGKKASNLKSVFEVESQQPRDCILFGLSGQEVTMAVPSVVTLLVDHMNLQAPILDEQVLGSSKFVQKHCELLDEIVERCAQLLGCTPEVLMARIYSTDTTDTVQLAFKQTRALMKELTIAYMRGWHLAGSRQQCEQMVCRNGTRGGLGWDDLSIFWSLAQLSLLRRAGG